MCGGIGGAVGTLARPEERVWKFFLLLGFCECMCMDVCVCVLFLCLFDLICVVKWRIVKFCLAPLARALVSILRIISKGHNAVKTDAFLFFVFLIFAYWVLTLPLGFVLYVPSYTTPQTLTMTAWVEPL